MHTDMALQKREDKSVSQARSAGFYFGGTPAPQYGVVAFLSVTLHPASVGD